MSVDLSTCLANNGMTSVRRMPGTTVLIGLNSPRTFDGASGLGSQISMWLGPPWRKTKITLLARPQPLFNFGSAGADSARACRRRISARLMPSIPAPPTRRNSRRLKPSQVLPGFPGIEIILFSYRLWFMRLAVKQKCRAVQQCPRQVLRRLQARAFLGKLDCRALLRVGRAVQAADINLLDQFLVVFFRFHQFGDLIVGLVHSVTDGHSVDHIQRVGKGDVAR